MKQNAPEIELKNKFGSDAKIYRPENVFQARLYDLATKILSYQDQYACAKSAEEKEFIEGKHSELRQQTLLGL